MPEPQFVRFVIWIGARKGLFLGAHALAAALLGVVALFVSEQPLNLGDTVFIGLVAAAGGVAFGWFMWQLFIWPTLAAYPGSPELPPGQRPKSWDEP